MKQFMYSPRRAFMKGLPSSFIKHWIELTFPSFATYFSPELKPNKEIKVHLLLRKKPNIIRSSLYQSSAMQTAEVRTSSTACAKPNVSSSLIQHASILSLSKPEILFLCLIRFSLKLSLLYY